jgi:hypothetical protein
VSLPSPLNSGSDIDWALHRTLIPFSITYVSFGSALHLPLFVVDASHCFLYHSELIDTQPYHHCLHPYLMTSSISFNSLANAFSLSFPESITVRRHTILENPDRYVPTQPLCFDREDRLSAVSQFIVPGK